MVLKVFPLFLTFSSVLLELKAEQEHLTFKWTDMLLLLQEHHVWRDPVPVRVVHIVFRPGFLQRLGNAALQRPLHIASCDRHGSVRSRRFGPAVSRYVGT
jgi:hypothetical protein